MDCLEAVYTRRAVRQFTADPVSGEHLLQVVEAAIQAPSGANIQAWAFLVLRDPERIRRLRALAPGMVVDPRAVVVVCLDRTRIDSWGGAYDSRRGGLEIGLATQTLLLAAHATGLGCCPVTSFHHRAVKLFLGLPDPVDPVVMVAAGYAATSTESPGRRPLGEMCFFERWGSQYANHEG